MPMEITFELSDSDLEYFKEFMLSARKKVCNKSEEEIIEGARSMLSEIWSSGACDFIRERMSRMETMIGMLVDTGWGLEAEDRERVVLALAYFSEPEDLIPDDIPGLGYLDDAIMIEMVNQELKHEIQAYTDFCVFRAAEVSRLGEDAMEMGRSDWLEERRKQLHARMRRRRGASQKKGGSRFSLF